MAHAESSILPATDLDFGYIHAFFIFGAIVTYFVDLVLGKFLKITVWMYVCMYTMYSLKFRPKNRAKWMKYEITIES